MSVRQLAGLLVATTALPLILLAAVMLNALLSNARSTSRAEFMTNARTLAALVDSEIENSAAIASTFAASGSLARGDVGTFQNSAKQLTALRPGSAVELIASTGDILFSTSPGDRIPAELAKRLASNQMLLNGKPALVDRSPDITSKHVRGYYAYPVLRDNQLAYVIAVALTSDRFYQMVSKDFPARPAVAVLDRERRFVARFPDHERRVGTLAAEGWRAEIDKSPSGFAQTITLEGEPAYTAFVTTRYGWIAGLSYPKSVVDAPATDIIGSLLPMMGLALIASALLGTLLSGRLSHALRSLARDATSVGGGAVVEWQPLAISEADEIGTAISTTSKSLDERTQALRRAHEASLSLVLNAPFGVFLVDSHLHVIEVSQGALNTFGRSRKTIVGHPLAQFLRSSWSDGAVDHMTAHINRVVQQGGPYHEAGFAAVRKDDGQQETLDWHVERVVLSNGAPAAVCYFYDLTPQRRAEAATKASEARFRSIFVNSPTGVAVKDLEGRLLAFNPAFAQMLGYSEDELPNKDFLGLVHPEDRQRTERDVQRLLDDNIDRLEMEHRFIRRSGEEVWVHRQMAVTTEWGTEPSLLCLMTDISERRTAELQIRESAAFTQRVLDSLTIFVGVTSLDGTLLETNRAPQQRAGLTAAEVIGKKFWDCYWWTHSDDDRDRLIAAFNTALTGETVRYDVQVKVANDELIWVDFQLAPMRDGQGRITHLIPSGIDLTERRRAEQLVRSQLAEIEALYLNAPIGLALLDRDCRFLRINDAMATINGVPRSDHLGRVAWEIVPTLQEIVEPKLLSVFESGRMIDAEVEGETPASPGVTRCWQAKFYPLLGPDGAVSAVGLTVEETTERKAAIEHQRFLLRELAHRQKNMLAVIQGMATQTARGASDTAHFLEAFTQRLQALAISLDLLLSTQWTGAQVRELIARHLQPFAPSPERLDLEGPNVWVDPDSTQAIGLALHELGTNAVKYGAWSSPNGLVGVAWKFTSAGDLELRWQESGGPPVKPPGQKGFGDVVIRKMVAHKVGGIVELDFSPEGLTWRVIIPSDHLRRAA